MKKISDEFRDLILADLQRDGKQVDKQTIKEYKTKIDKAFDELVAEAHEEIERGEFVTLDNLKRDLHNTTFPVQRLSGIERIIHVLEEEIERHDRYADEFPFNDEAYVQMEIELDKLEKVLVFTQGIQEKKPRQSWDKEFLRMHDNGDDQLPDWDGTLDEHLIPDYKSVDLSISACPGDNCDRKDNCQRYEIQKTIKPGTVYTSICPSSDCKVFIPINKP